jgi:hypothetical protein
MMILKRFRQEHGKETLIRGFSSSEGFYYLNHCLKIQIQNKDVKIPKIPCFGDSSELVARIAALPLIRVIRNRDDVFTFSIP